MAEVMAHSLIFGRNFCGLLAKDASLLFHIFLAANVINEQPGDVTGGHPQFLEHASD